jgi:hypothetical protein
VKGQAVEPPRCYPGSGWRYFEGPPNTSIQNISGLPQGLAPPSGGKLIMRASVRAICQSRWSTMKQQAIEGRRDRAADIMDVGVYAIVILVVMLLWVYIPA